jgi:shikimate dehydrogenase
MMLFGLIGYPLGHSFSKEYFTQKFKQEGLTDYAYENFPIPQISELHQVITDHPDLMGLNVTIPYKEQVLKYLDDIDSEADAVGAVNTICITRNHGAVHLKGYNSDIYGFERSIKPYLTSLHTKALILGTGGASKAIKYVLTKNRIAFVSASIEELKENEIPYAQVTPEVVNERKLIINATPLGTYPNVDQCVSIPYQAITPEHILFDLVYNPPETKFMRLGKERGATIINGLGMLHGQAERSWEIWNTGTS